MIDLVEEDTLLIVNLDDEPVCELKHEVPKSICSITATHVLTCCIGAVLMCDNGTRYQRKVMSAHGAICNPCGQPVIECWRIRQL